MHRPLLFIIAAVAAFLPSVASAAYVFSSTGNDTTITLGGDQPGTSSTLYLKLTGKTATSYTFTYDLTNTSDSTLNPFARVSGFGFVADPVASGGSVSGSYSKLHLDPPAGQLGTAVSADGLCVANSGSCSGPGGATLSTDATGTLTLTFATAPSSLSLSDFGVRYQSLGLNQEGSGRGFETVAPPVPEPATWALMLLGFAGIGVGIRRSVRRRTLAIA